MRILLFFAVPTIIVISLYYFLPAKILNISGITGTLDTIKHTIKSAEEIIGLNAERASNIPKTVEKSVVAPTENSLEGMSDLFDSAKSNARTIGANLLGFSENSSTAILVNQNGFEVCETIKKNELADYEIKNPSSPKKNFTVRVTWGDQKISDYRAQGAEEKITVSHAYTVSGSYTSVFAITNASTTTIFQKLICVN